MDDDFVDTFRMNMKFYREKMQWSQTQLAVEIDCTGGSIGMIEAGKSKPSFDMIVKIAKALNISPADLFLRDASSAKRNVRKILNTILEKDFPKIFEERFSL